MMKQLIVTGLTKTFGQGDNIVHALSDVNLSVEKGEFLAIMGASGSGKTTTLKLINRLIEQHFSTVFQRLINQHQVRFDLKILTSSMPRKMN